MAIRIVTARQPAAPKGVADWQAGHVYPPPPASPATGGEMETHIKSMRFEAPEVTPRRPSGELATRDDPRRSDDSNAQRRFHHLGISPTCEGKALEPCISRLRNWKYRRVTADREGVRHEC